MTWPRFDNLDVECWEFPGKLGLTRPTLCLVQAAKDRGRPILLALDELKAEPPPVHRTLTFKPSMRKGSITRLRLLLVLPRDELRAMHIAWEGETATIEMTATGLTVLHKAVSTWCNGSEDFGVHPGHAGLAKHELGPLDKASGELWFWGPTMEP